jgi:hypothetical protein
MQEEAPMASKKTLCVDFDGVLHSYTSGWGGHESIADAPVPGAFEFLYDALSSFNVAIYSSRSSTSAGIAAMQKWVELHAKPLFFDYGRPWWLQLEWPVNKPAAYVTIDDRAICFDGTWPTILELINFKPWYQKLGPADLQTNLEAATQNSAQNQSQNESSLAKAVKFLAEEGEGA